MFSSVPEKHGVKMLGLGNNSRDGFTLRFLLRKTSKGKVSAKYKYLAMWIQFNDQKSQSPSVSPGASIEAAGRANSDVNECWNISLSLRF